MLAAALTFAPSAPARQDDACAAPGEEAARGEGLSVRWKVSALREALDKFESARACWERTGQRREEAGALKRIGDIHFALSEYNPSVEAYAAALARRRELGDQRAEAHALVDLGRALLFTLRLDEALKNALEGASIARGVGDQALEARAENVTGKFYYRRGDYQKAAAHYVRALSLAREAAAPAEEAAALYNAGQVHSDLGEVSEALTYYQRALPLWRAANDRQGEVRTFTSVGLAYSLLGESQTALEYLDGMALPSLREAGDRMGEAAAHNNIGYVYESLGDRETALTHYRKALALFDDIKMAAGQAATSIYVGEVCARLGRAQEAQENYERAFAHSRALGNRLLEAEVLNSMGELRLSAGRAGEAFEMFTRALSTYEKAGYRRGQAVALNNIGWYFGGRHDWRTAAGYFRKALEFSRAASDRLGESLTLYNIARAEFELGNDVEARENVEGGLRLSEMLRTKIVGGDLRTSYFASAHRQFELYVAVLMRLYRSGGDPALAAAAFEASERARARTLLDMLAEAGADIRRGVEPALLRRERELQLRLDAKADRRIHLLGDASAVVELAELERQMDALSAEYRRLQSQIRAASPAYAALFQPAPLTLAEIRRKVLDADTVLLEYWLGEERSFVWALTSDSLSSAELPGRAEVEKQARRLYGLINARNRLVKGETEQQWQARIRKAEAEYAEASEALGEMLLEPVAGALEKRRVLVVADGALQYVPFAALPTPSSRNVTTAGRVAGGGKAPAPAVGPSPDPLILNREVINLPSASVLARLREELRDRRPAPRSVAVLADPIFERDDERLSATAAGGRRPGSAVARRQARDGGEAARVPPRALRDFDGLGEWEGLGRLVFSRREAEAITALAPSGSSMLALGFRANRATATGPELPHYRIIHFATHGLLNTEHPELSGIILSLFDETGGHQEGFLQSHEVYNLNLPADLVVLSACQTALGKEIRGEGLVGLTRGFMYAGAARVVASLWKVDDAATAELMREFYRSMLIEGKRPAAALSAAQVYMSRQRRWRSPYYWAGFTLQGEWR